MTADHLTVGDVASIFGAPAWKVRRIVDSLPEELPRAGNYRLIPRAMLPTIGSELQRSGHLPTSGAAAR